jgi:hypothetical protein
MQSKRRNALGALAMFLGCAACCALPIFLTGGIAGVLGGLAAEFGKLNGWMVGAMIAALVLLVGGWWFVRKRTRTART